MGSKDKRRKRLGSNTNPGKDRLSSLPDALLIDILNLIPIETAIQTSILSTRWRYLWTHLTNLFFDPPDCHLRVRGLDWPDSELAAVDRILNRIVSPKIRRFSLELKFGWTCNYEQCSPHVDSWLGQICTRHHPEEIELRSHNSSIYYYILVVPTCVFLSQSLKSLALVGGLSIKLPDDGIVNTVNLVTLHLDIPVLDPDLLAVLFKSSLRLEHVFLQGKFGDTDTNSDSCCLDLSSQKLRYLHIKVLEGLPARVKFVINASELRHLMLHSPCLASYRFVEIPSASNLKSADTCLESGFLDRDDYLSHIKDFGRIICSVTTLCLNATVLKALNDVHDDVLFDNLKQLNVKLDCSNGPWSDVLVLLGRCNNLKVLNVSLNEGSTKPQVINWVDHNDVPSCLESRLKTVRLDDLRCNPAEVKMIKFILNYSSALEVLFVHIAGTGTLRGTQISKEHNFCTSLFRLSRSSSISEIEFVGSRLKASSRDFRHNALKCQINNWGYWGSSEDDDE